MISAFPLAWPADWPRSNEHFRSQYRVAYKLAVADLLNELRLLGAEHVIISSNAAIRRRDGLPYTEAATERCEHPGVAVYFTLESEPTVIACDQWDTVKDNIRAIGNTVSALRAIQRSGATELLRRAFRGFRQLSGPASESWFTVLGLPVSATPDEIKLAHRRLAKIAHPDHGGNAAEMQRLNGARDKGMTLRKQPS